MPHENNKRLRDEALRLLSRRDYSRRELAYKLAPYARRTEEVSELLDELTKLGYLSDEKLADAYVAYNKDRYGLLRIKQNLLQRGIDEATIDNALRNYCDEEQTAYSVWQKKFGCAPLNVQEKARHWRFLMSRGFSIDTVQRIITRSAATTAISTPSACTDTSPLHQTVYKK